MTPTEQFIQKLESLEPGTLGLLRNHAGLSLDESVAGFDLFAGLWWPLRQKNPRTPRREVAWLIAKLYAFCPLPQTDGVTLAHLLGRAILPDENAGTRHQRRFDALLMLPLAGMEPALRWALKRLADAGKGLDWVRLTEDLSFWDREETRLKWAKGFLGIPC
jgi:CRISPR type I-E-associated protein CasB/Cse2